MHRHTSDGTMPAQEAFSRQIRELVASCREGYGLPGRFYQDEALYAYEWETIWRQGWIFVGHTC